MVVLMGVLFLGAASPAQAQAGALPAASGSPSLFAGLGDYVIGNRTRMIQVTCIGFGLAVLILVTASRKH